MDDLELGERMRKLKEGNDGWPPSLEFSEIRPGIWWWCLDLGTTRVWDEQVNTIVAALTAAEKHFAAHPFRPISRGYISIPEE